MGNTQRLLCVLQVALLVLCCIPAALAADAGQNSSTAVNAQQQYATPQYGEGAAADSYKDESYGEHYGSSSGSSRVVVPCTRNIFAGTKFFSYSAAQFQEMQEWVTKNQLLIEGISPMVNLNFYAYVDSLTQTPGIQAIFNSTGPLSTKAASWTPLFYLPEDAECSLGRATAQYQAAHPNGPLLLMNVSVLTGPLNDEPGAWQPQGFYARLDSAQDGMLFEGQRLYDHGNRPNPIRSVTKAITAAAFMALVDREVVTLDDHAADYVPAFRQGELANITYRMLLSHTSGLPFIVDQGKALLDPYITLMESATIIAEEYPLVFPPGTNFAYTELGFQVVGAAMEAMTGRKFQSLVREYITNPLGMDSTEIHNQWKAGYSTNPNPAFGGVASPSDIRAFMRMLLARGLAEGPYGKQHRVLSEASVREITTPQPNTAGFGTLVGPGTDYYVGYLQAAGLISPRAAAIARCVIFGDMEYGLGVPLSQVENGVAKNVVIIGGAGQFFVIPNFNGDNAQHAYIAGSSNFMNLPWGYFVSSVVISEMLAGVPEPSYIDASACLQKVAGGAAAPLSSLRMPDPTLPRIG